MAYAPHTNDDVKQQLQLGQIPTPLPLVMGWFRHAETGVGFEFAERRHPDDSFAPELGFMVYVGDGQTRLAKVLKTVAFVAVDENPDGSAVIERWPLKQFRAYDTAWVRA